MRAFVLLLLCGCKTMEQVCAESCPASYRYTIDTWHNVRTCECLPADPSEW